MEYLDWVQWPAMLVTIAAAWMVGSEKEGRRQFGFWVFITSNLLWVIWALYSDAYALIVLQIALAAMNIRGSIKNSK
ncbi:hypothetical protein [Denitrificimonas caeni]|uniref:hypothetical protein n=1 Tax=Denitrificimonas caeni TaxID=521720 RepID=UPI001963A2CA|nr:hypothetical protein [Denitrificimonas caeni]